MGFPSSKYDHTQIDEMEETDQEQKISVSEETYKLQITKVWMKLIVFRNLKEDNISFVKSNSTINMLWIQ